jgi:putative phosphoesterase
VTFARVRSPSLLRQHATIPVRTSGERAGGLRLAVIADTHSQPHGDTKRHLTALAPDALLHAGDIGDLGVLADLGTVAPLHAVRGNIDTRAAALPDDLVLDLVDGDAVRLRIFVTHIAVYGPKLRADVARRARAEDASLVVCGHSHVPFIGIDKGSGRSAPLTIFNPGSVGPRRFHLPIVFGTIDVSPTGVRLAHFDCETGRAWSP